MAIACGKLVGAALCRLDGSPVQPKSCRPQLMGGNAGAEVAKDYGVDIVLSVIVILFYATSSH